VDVLVPADPGFGVGAEKNTLRIIGLRRPLGKNGAVCDIGPVAANRKRPEIFMDQPVVKIKTYQQARY
jgi:hypothetical protein